MGDLLPIRHELTRYFEGECSGHAPSHQVVGALGLHAPDEFDVPGRYFFQRIGQRGIFHRWIEQLQRVHRLFRTQILGQPVIDSGVVDYDQGALRAMRLNFDHLAKIEFAQIRLRQQLGEVMQRRREKQRCQLDAPSELPLDLGQHPRSQQGVASQFEKIVAGRNRFHAQYPGPERRQALLDLAGRLLMRRVPVRASLCRLQRIAVDGTAHRMRQRVAHDDGRRHQILGKGFRECSLQIENQRCGIRRGAAGDHEGGDRTGAVRILGWDHRGLGDARVAQQHRLDFGGVDHAACVGESIVRAADVFDLPVGLQPTQGAGRVQLDSGFVGDGRGERALCQSVAADVHFADDADRRDAQRRLQHVQCRVCNRLAKARGDILGFDQADRGPDAGFGTTVQ